MHNSKSFTLGLYCLRASVFITLLIAVMGFLLTGIQTPYQPHPEIKLFLIGCGMTLGLLGLVGMHFITRSLTLCGKRGLFSIDENCLEFSGKLKLYMHLLMTSAATLVVVELGGPIATLLLLHSGDEWWIPAISTPVLMTLCVLIMLRIHLIELKERERVLSGTKI